MHSYSSAHLTQTDIPSNLLSINSEGDREAMALGRAQASVAWVGFVTGVMVASAATTLYQRLHFWNQVHDTKGLRHDVILVCVSWKPGRREVGLRHTMPAAMASSICSNLAFAVTEMTGTCPTIKPLRCNSRILRTHVSPSMVGISVSIRTSDRCLPVCARSFQKVDSCRKAIASPP